MGSAVVRSRPCTYNSLYDRGKTTYSLPLCSFFRGRIRDVVKTPREDHSSSALDFLRYQPAHPEGSSFRGSIDRRRYGRPTGFVRSGKRIKRQVKLLHRDVYVRLVGQGAAKGERGRIATGEVSKGSFRREGIFIGQGVRLRVISSLDEKLAFSHVPNTGAHRRPRFARYLCTHGRGTSFRLARSLANTSFSR